MNREIKFRAWDKERKDMRQVQLMDWSDWWVSTGHTWERENSPRKAREYGERNSFKNERTDRHILMQYTGLRDKNGVEIYEGDVLKGKHYMNGSWHRIVGQVVFSLARFCIDGVGQYEGIMRIEFDLSFEVIGNIYENPELLGGGEA